MRFFWQFRRRRIRPPAFFLRLFGRRRLRISRIIPLSVQWRLLGGGLPRAFPEPNGRGIKISAFPPLSARRAASQILMYRIGRAGKFRQRSAGHRKNFFTRMMESAEKIAPLLRGTAHTAFPGFRRRRVCRADGSRWHSAKPLQYCRGFFISNTPCRFPKGSFRYRLYAALLLFWGYGGFWD